MWIPSVVLSVVFTLLLLLVSSSTPVFAQGEHCDPGLKQVHGDSYGYRPRGDRCEGIYVRQVQGSALRFVSLVESVEDFNPTINKNLVVQWVAPARTNVRLRAYGLRHRLYYRMDTLRPAGSTSYTWAPNMLGALTLKKHELGLVAWVSQQVDTQNRDVYLPLRLTQQTTPTKSTRYEVIMLPGVELSEVFVSLAPLNPNGRPGTYIQQREPLRWGFYPAERKVTIALPELRASGIYYLEIGATLRGGGSSTKQIWFYHQH